MQELFPDGGSAGYVPDFKRMLNAYYQARGWDSDTGKPSREKLVGLGLEDIANDLCDEAGCLIIHLSSSGNELGTAIRARSLHHPRMVVEGIRRSQRIDSLK